VTKKWSSTRSGDGLTKRAASKEQRRDGRTSAKDAYDPDAWKAWDKPQPPTTPEAK